MQYLALLLCYLLGAIPFGVIVGRVMRGIDIRDYGSGNIGASNVLRTLGPVPAFTVFFFDTIKGLAAVALCIYLPLSCSQTCRDLFVVAGGILSILGHSFSCFLRFQGGRAVATSLGVMIGLTPVIAAIAFGIWVLLVALTRYISLGSIVAAASVPVMAFVWESQQVPLPYQVVAALAAALIVVKHIPNIKRLLSGTETKIGQKARVESEIKTDE